MRLCKTGVEQLFTDEDLDTFQRVWWSHEAWKAVVAKYDHAPYEPLYKVGPFKYGYGLAPLILPSPWIHIPLA